jgi:hypothetical protein
MTVDGITGYAIHGVIEAITQNRLRLGIYVQPPVTRDGPIRGCETNGIGYRTTKHLNLDIAADGRYSATSPNLARKMRDFDKPEGDE